MHVTLSKLVDFSGFFCVGNIWDKLSIHLNRKFNKGLVIYFVTYFVFLSGPTMK